MFAATLRVKVGLAAIGACLIVASAVALGQARASTVRTPSTGVVIVNTNLGYEDNAAAGTGIVLKSSGEVLTNNHVIRGATSIHVTDLSTGKTYTASVEGYDVGHDIAVIKLANAHGLQTASIGSSSGVNVGDKVTAVGNAGGTGSLTVATGAVTRLHESITVNDDQGGSARLADLIETDAALQPGDSGGPLLTGGNRVIGVDAAASTGGGFQSGSADGYAIPINTAISIAKQIEAGHSSSTVHIGPTAFLGISLQPAGYGPDVTGASVEGVVPGGAADQAGLTGGDVITSFGGHSVTSPTSLQLLLRQAKPGSSYQVIWLDQYGTQASGTVRPASGPPQ